MNKIQALNLKLLRNEEAFAYFQLTESETQYLTDESTLSAVNSFKENQKSFDEVLKDSKSVPSATVASERDAKRDFAYNGLNACAKAIATYHPELEIRETGQEVVSILGKYGNPTALPQTQESGVLHNLLQDLYAMDGEQLVSSGLKPFVDELSECEEMFLAAVTDRTAEEAARVTGIVMQTRKATEVAYRSLINLVNALVLVNGETAYATFIDHMNALIDRQKTVLKARATNSSKKSEAEEEEATEVA